MFEGEKRKKPYTATEKHNNINCKLTFSLKPPQQGRSISSRQHGFLLLFQKHSTNFYKQLQVSASIMLSVALLVLDFHQQLPKRRLRQLNSQDYRKMVEDAEVKQRSKCKKGFKRKGSLCRL